MFIIDPNFKEPYELIEEIPADAFPGGKFLWEGHCEDVWKVEKIVEMKFKGEQYSRNYVYLISWKNPEEWDIVDGLSFINGYTPVGTAKEGIKENFFENLCTH